MKIDQISIIFLVGLLSFVLRSEAQNYRYVDPIIGSEGLGRVFIGPSFPFGMVKPGPDCTSRPNNASRKGIPGNDDSGAMSSWLAFHLTGLYPNAGQAYYLLNSPLIKETTFHLSGGHDFTIFAKNLSPENKGQGCQLYGTTAR